MNSASPIRTDPNAHPSRRAGRVALIGLEVFIAVNAVYGGVGLVINGMGMPDEWLVGTPFGTWLLPGLALLAIIAVPMGIAAAAEWRRLRWAPRASMIAGAAQVGWIVVQLIVLQRFFFLQPVLFVLGVAVLLLAWYVHRGELGWRTTQMRKG